MPLFCCISGIFYRRIDFSSNTHSCKVFCSWVYWLQKSDLDHPGPLVYYSLTTRLFEWLFFCVIRSRAFKWCTQLRFSTTGSNKNDLTPLKIDFKPSLTTSGGHSCNFRLFEWSILIFYNFFYLTIKSRPLDTTIWPFIDHLTEGSTIWLEWSLFWMSRPRAYDWFTRLRSRINGLKVSILPHFTE